MKPFLNLLAAVLVSFGMISIMIVAWSNLYTEKIGVEEVPCYDRHNNVIEGLVCEDNVYSDPIGLVLLPYGAFAFMLGLILLGITETTWGRSK